MCQLPAAALTHPDDDGQLLSCMTQGGPVVEPCQGLEYYVLAGAVTAFHAWVDGGKSNARGREDSNWQRMQG